MQRELIVEKDYSKERLTFLYDGDKMSITIFKKSTTQKYHNTLSNDKILRQTNKKITIEELLNDLNRDTCSNCLVRIHYLEKEAIIIISYDSKEFGKIQFQFQTIKEQENLHVFDKQELKDKVIKLEQLLMRQQEKFNNMSIAIKQLTRQQWFKQCDGKSKKTFNIRNCASFHVIDVDLWKNKKVAKTYPYHNGLNQQFQIQAQRNGVYKILAMFPNQFLTVCSKTQLRFQDQKKQRNQQMSQLFKINEIEDHPGIFSITTLDNLCLGIQWKQDYTPSTYSRNTMICLQPFTPKYSSKKWKIVRAAQLWSP